MEKETVFPCSKSICTCFVYQHLACNQVCPILLHGYYAMAQRLLFQFAWHLGFYSSVSVHIDRVYGLHFLQLDVTPCLLAPSNGSSSDASSRAVWSLP